jgi:hypothetical protein
VRDKITDLIQRLLDHKAAGSEPVVRSRGETGNRKLDELFPRVNTLSPTLPASSAGRSTGDRAGPAATLTRTGTELREDTASDLAGRELTR